MVLPFDGVSGDLHVGHGLEVRGQRSQAIFIGVSAILKVGEFVGDIILRPR